MQQKTELREELTVRRCRDTFRVAAAKKDKLSSNPSQGRGPCDWSVVRGNRNSGVSYSTFCRDANNISADKNLWLNPRPLSIAEMEPCRSRPQSQ